MKVAVAGKGGSGKTVVAALLAQALAIRHPPVLAVDLDTNPGLALTLGVDADDEPLAPDLVVEDDDAPYGWGLPPDRQRHAVVEQYGLPAPGGVRYLGFGNIGRTDHDVGRYLYAVRQVVAGIGPPWTVVADLEAGPATPFEGFTRPMDLVLICVEPTPAACLAAERIASICRHDGVAAAAVATKVRDGSGPDVVASGLEELEVVATVPYDPAIEAAERTGPLTDLDTRFPAHAAVADLAVRLEELAARSATAGTDRNPTTEEVAAS